MALALMPRDQVRSSFDEIANTHILPGLPMKQLLDYFEDYWMRGIDLWNVLSSNTRTNNPCEGEERTTD